MDEEFAINPGDYLQGKELDAFRSGEFFELSSLRRSFRLVKSVRDKAYFSAYHQYKYSEISMNTGNELMMSPLSNDSKLDFTDCSESTLQIEDRLYCWSEMEYSHLYKIGNPGN